jgi:hypothetical protein
LPKRMSVGAAVIGDDVEAPAASFIEADASECEPL